MTGGRIHSIREYVQGEKFLCTYGDGVADIDLKALTAFHNSHKKTATVTAVRPTNRFGAMALDEKIPSQSLLKNHALKNGSTVATSFLSLGSSIISMPTAF